MLRHVVMIKLKEGFSADYCHELIGQLALRVESVRSVSCGFDIVKSASSFDYCFVVEFADLNGLKEYESSNYHQLIRGEIRKIRSASHAVDFCE